MKEQSYDIIIIGAGAAGLAAGIYASRAKLNVLILNEGTTGGQMVLTHEIANYPGVETISGYQLAGTMKKQATSFGCTIRSNIRITCLDLKSSQKKVEVNNKDTYYGNAVILAPGGRPRMLNVPGEEEFKGKGISYCATCDGDFFQDKEIAVVGGGNSALEEAVSLTKYASKVTIVHQFDHFQAFEHAILKARENEKIEFIMGSEIQKFEGHESLKSAIVKNLKTERETFIDIDGAFIFIGYVPNTSFLENIIKLNEYGEILTDEKMRTDIEGVYAAGDCIHKPYRQVTTAVADGTIAALTAAKYVNDLNRKKKETGMQVQV